MSAKESNEVERAAPVEPPAPGRETREQPTTIAWGWFPADDYQHALARWPELTEPGGPAAGGRDHARYCLAMQAKLRDAADAGMTGIRIAPIRIQAFLAWCDLHSEDPAAARARYAADLARLRPDELIAWPPGRNAPCWCGSGRKYKKCCAAPEAAGQP